MLCVFSVYHSERHTDLASSSSTSQHKLHFELMMISSEARQAGDLSKGRPGGIPEQVPNYTQDPSGQRLGRQPVATECQELTDPESPEADTEGRTWCPPRK